MIIKSITLNNIRSYVNQRIYFNNGVIVLSGDIGSGKTTVLLALEFALFGIYDSGDYLLRKGENEGSVELSFLLNNQEYTIKRFLKRKSDGVRQLNGYVITNNVKKDLTPIELKQFIISLLGYPQESLNKKSLIYRYTTYTPQDEMKQVLYENSDERISIIRKIFGIDKYQRIIENSAVFARYLRESKRELLGKISDLEIKKDNLKRLNEEKSTLIKKEIELDIKLVEAKRFLEDFKKKAFAMEAEIKKTHELRREKAALEASIKHKEEQIISIKRELERLQQEVSSLKEKISPDKLEEIKKKLKPKIREEIFELEKKQLITQKQIGELEALKTHSEKTKMQITELNDCPLCLQSVPHSHKDRIKAREDEKLNEITIKLNEANKSIFEIKKKLIEKNNELHESNNSERELSLINLYIKNSSEKEVNIKDKNGLLIKATDELSELKEKNSKIQLISFENKENEYNSMKKEVEKHQLNERSIEIEKTRISSEVKNNEKLELLLKNEINEKEKSKEKLDETTKLENWVQNNFANIISLMEKYVLSNIYFAFNDQFKEMFELLIDDERLLASIDETFTPKIEQNGYETEFDNLSGGEKTSLSLAYRLALNKAINNVMSGIKTRNLLILDEPTDGFSSEQIDKMKDLFNNLNSTQTIIVSHESKIESIADHVIRIVKNSHESQILA